MVNILFDIRNLAHYYNDLKALDISSLQFEKGKVYSIIGPNGAGKTTLLHILAFLLKPTAGVLLYEGNEAGRHDLHRLRREITLVGQNPYLLSTTVGRNVSYGLKLRGFDRETIEKRVEEGLRVVGLLEKENKPARELSGGEARRLALARAFALKSKVLMLDEPLAHIDTGHTKVIEDVIKEFNRLHETTVIFTTHDLIQATQLSDRLITMREGKIVTYKEGRW